MDKGVLNMLIDGMIGELRDNKDRYQGSFKLCDNSILFVKNGFGSEWTVVAFTTMIDCYEFRIIDCTDVI